MEKSIIVSSPFTALGVMKLYQISLQWRKVKSNINERKCSPLRIKRMDKKRIVCSNVPTTTKKKLS